MDSPTNSSGQKGGLFALIFLAVILMILAVILIIWFPSDPSAAPSESRSADADALNRYSCDAAEAQKLYPFGSNLLRIDKDRVSCLDLAGNEKFGETVNMETPVCRISGDYGLVMDIGGTSFLLINSNGVVYRSSAKSTLDYGYVNPSGYVAVVYDKPGIKGAVRLYAPDGSARYEWESAESGYIVSACIAPDNQSLDISLLNTDSVEPFPLFKRFSMEGEAIAQYSPDIPRMLPVILYCDNHPVLCGATDILSFIDQQEIYHQQFFKVYTAAAAGDSVLVVAKTRADDSPMLYRLSADGTQSAGILLSEEVTPIAVCGNTAAVGSGTSIVCVDISGMKVLSRVSLNSTVMRVGLAQSGHLLIAVAGDGAVHYLVK